MYLDSELILNADGSVFHLQMKPEQLADKVILVGDRGRVVQVSAFFDSVECERQNREFHSVTGTYKGKRLTVLSTGIGVGNIDIVVNELDALANIDLKLRADRAEHRSLEIVRIGTSGGLQPETPEGCYVASAASFGFDGLLHFYGCSEAVRDVQAEEAFLRATDYPAGAARPYCVHSNEALLKNIAADMVKGYTLCAHGFYAPQGRALRYALAKPKLNEQIRGFEYGGLKACNFEMESAPLEGLAALLGHHALTVCLIIANRYGKSFVGDYKPLMNGLIEKVLNRI